MKKLLPILLALIGTAAGVAAGLFLAPAPPMEDAAHGAEAAADGAAHAAPEDPHAAAEPGETGGDHGEGANEYVRLNNQFVVPVVGSGRIESLVVLSLSLEVGPGNNEAVFAQEPKLRDVFLRVLFDHANIGGFEGNFTEQHRLDRLRRALWEAARNVMGGVVIDVLITEIARQDS